MGMRVGAAVAMCLALVGGSAAADTPARPGAGRAAMAAPAAVARSVIVTYRAPLAGQLLVLRRFDPPSTPYGPGHLGVDLALGAGGLVLAAGAGTVRFAGPVAGRGVVVIAHPDGISTECEPVRPLVRAGVAVPAGQPIGRLTGAHRGCTGSCLHWGARRGGNYIDPLSLLRPLGPVRLLPWHPVDATLRFPILMRWSGDAVSHASRPAQARGCACL
jgi:murein DD-endopeptidase MepM/ murein hydrolase activator NlpD